MGNPACQDPQGLELARTVQFGFELAAFGHVTEHEDHSHHIATRVAHRCSAGHDNPFRAISRAEDCLHAAADEWIGSEYSLEKINAGFPASFLDQMKHLG